jgi:hypothetical protein
VLLQPVDVEPTLPKKPRALHLHERVEIAERGEHQAALSSVYRDVMRQAVSFPGASVVRQREDCTLSDEVRRGGYFDSIPHEKLMKCVRMRVVDGAVLGLIKQWLEAPIVEEVREEGKGDRTPRYKETRNSKGTPQGGVASPLLANIYLHWFDRVFHSERGPAQWAKATLIRYADDFAILSRKITPRLESFVSEKIEQWLGLKINRDKTRIYEVKVSGNGLDFLVRFLHQMMVSAKERDGWS